MGTEEVAVKALLGALNTVVGGVVHAASGGWLCRVCGRTINTGSNESRCAWCIRNGKQ